MSVKVSEEEASSYLGDGTSSPVSPSMANVLPIYSVDTSTGEEMLICSNPRLTEGVDPFRTNPIRWAAMDVSSIMVDEDMRLLRESYRIPSDIGLMTVYQPRKLLKKKDKEEELGWYYFYPWGAHKPTE
ncbi:hypothetical protein Adt_11531 [Abeliophyllum distichum]|uniref:Uncharacterized protein n=1 Tax=Abeliophyllum distichum TaxID=126358 RepID=A0ABD1UNI6_9LAMI